MKKYIIYLIFICFYSCSNYSSEVKISLQMAEKNKNELEKVLSYYRKDKKDSLKYKAACFLINNMKWHSGSQVQLSNQFWELFMYEDSLTKLKIATPNDTVIDNELYIYKQKKKKRKIQNCLSNSSFSEGYNSDLRTLSAQFLINTIDEAFEVRNLDWNKNLSFEEFCEYILPYRFNNEPTLDIRKNLQTHFQSIVKNDTLIDNPVKVVSALNQYIKYFNWDWDNTTINFPDLGFYNILLWNTIKMTCAEFTVIEGQILRSIGIPVIEIFTPKWKINDLGHSWCCLLSQNKKLIPFSALYETPGIQKIEHSLDKTSKLYMRTYSDQKDSPHYLKTNTEQIPEVFSSPCIKDVTNNFVPTHDYHFDIEIKLKSNNLCYFCLYIYGEWLPVGWGQLDHLKQKAYFKNIPDGIVGMPCFLVDDKMIPSGKLVRTNSSGGYTVVQPSHEKFSIYATRKYPIKTGLQVFNDEVIGSILEGSNRIDFSDSKVLFTLKDTLHPYFQDFSFPDHNYYRYYRFTAPGYSLQFAELEFLVDRKEEGVYKAAPLPIFHQNDTLRKQEYKIMGKLIGVRKDSLAFDHNNLTYTVQKIITIDFGKPEKISKIRILPRNADNGITIGDNYELQYWENGWQSCGNQVAKYNFVKFDNISKGTLYLLSNKSKGREEQAFWYNNEKQIFMNN